MPEISVEGEPWLGLVVLGHMTQKWDSPGFYGVARADEWHSDSEYVTVWKGPALKDETISRDVLREMECRTVLVDKEGFYTCPPILEDLQADVKEESEKLLNEMANERAAESYSYIDLDVLGEKYDGKVFVKAEFGDAVAVNGELAFGRKRQKPPRNYELTDEGGHVPGGSEEEIEKERLIWEISQTLTQKLHRPIYEETVSELLDKLYPKDFIYWTADSGHVEVWASKRAIRDAETELERKHRLEDEERARRVAAEQKRREEERIQKEAQERLKMKKGGWPRPKDWSPRGRFPWERREQQR